MRVDTKTNVSGPSCLVTCGPASAPLDGVRRITNFATGEIGALLSADLTAAGYRVRCLRGVGSTFPMPAGVDCEDFLTNKDVLGAFRSSRAADVRAVFHAAALTDYELPESGIESGKVNSEKDCWRLTLVRSVKVLLMLRDLFPAALIVGWKYELNGDREDALERGRKQLKSARTDLCVVNGLAYGQGFGLVSSGGVQHLPTKSDLSRQLVAITASRG